MNIRELETIVRINNSNSFKTVELFERDELTNSSTGTVRVVPHH